MGREREFGIGNGINTNTTYQTQTPVIDWHLLQHFAGRILNKAVLGQAFCVFTF